MISSFQVSCLLSKLCTRVSTRNMYLRCQVAANLLHAHLHSQGLETATRAIAASLSGGLPSKDKPTRKQLDTLAS